MPWIGLPPFLPSIKIETEGQEDSVNALDRATSISTEYTDVASVEFEFECQCPGSGYLHFYGLIMQIKKLKEECVNALDRATSISTSLKEGKMKKVRFVSMPWIGLPPFLRSVLGTRINRGFNSANSALII